MHANDNIFYLHIYTGIDIMGYYPVFGLLATAHYKFFFTLHFSPFDFYCISPSFSDLFNTLGYSQPDYFQIQNIFLMFNFFSPFSPSKLSFSVLTSKTLKDKALYCLFLFKFLSALCYSLSPSPVPSETNTHSLDILFSTCLNWYPSTIKPNGFRTTPLLLSHQ